MDGPEPFRGLNEAEAALLRAIVENEAPVRLVDGLEPGAAADLRPRIEAIASMSDEERSALIDGFDGSGRPEHSNEEGATPGAGGLWTRVVEAWREGEAFDWIDSAAMRRRVRGVLEQWDRGDLPAADPAFRSDDPHHYDTLLRIEPPAWREFVLELGIFQLAELLRGENRRRVARVARNFSAERRELLIAAMGRERQLHRDEHSRLQEVFVTLTRHYEDLRERVVQLGLYTVAVGAGVRYRDRVGALVGRLPGELGDRLEHYYRLSQGSSRRGIGRHFRAAIRSFLAWRSEREE